MLNTALSFVRLAAAVILLTVCFQTSRLSADEPYSCESAYFNLACLTPHNFHESMECMDPDPENENGCMTCKSRAYYICGGAMGESPLGWWEPST